MKNNKGSFSVKENEEVVKIERGNVVAWRRVFEKVLKWLLTKFDLLET